MRILTSLAFAMFLSLSLPVVAFAEEGKKGEKIEIADLPAPVKEGFAKEVPGGEITSATKKVSGEKVRYQLKYTLEGKEHQITLDENGAPKGKKK